MNRTRMLSLVAALIVYALLWIGWVHDWAWLAIADHTLLDASYEVAQAHPVWTPAWDAICLVFGPFVLRVVAAGLIIWLLIRRETRTALFLFVTVELSAVLTEVAKRLADRPRPATHLVNEYGTSFPSGHALGVLVAVLALLAVARPLLTEQWWIPAAVIGAVIIVVIGIGRVALNVHHPSDVVAGWVLGYAYFLLCVAWAPPGSAGRVVTGETPAEPDTAR